MINCDSVVLELRVVSFVRRREGDAARHGGDENNEKNAVKAGLVNGHGSSSVSGLNYDLNEKTVSSHLCNETTPKYTLNFAPVPSSRQSM